MIKKIFSLFFWICTVLIPLIISLYFATPEYVSNDTNRYTYGSFKMFLCEPMKITVSRALMISIILIIVTVLCGIGCLLCNKFDYLNDKYKALQDENENLKSNLDSTISTDIEQNDEKRIIASMKNLCTNNIDIIGIQLYLCSETKISNNKICYKFIPTEYRYISSDESVNSVYETYNVNINSIKQYVHVKEKYLKDNKQVLNEYIKKLTDKLKHEYNNKITDTIINDYCFLILAYQLLLGDAQFEIKDLSREFQNKINRTKRTGFLRGAIEQNYYTFIHRGENRKHNRIYLTNIISIRNIPHMLVIVFKPEVVKKEKYNDYIEKVGEKFYNILEQELKVVYNNYKINEVGADKDV